MHNAGILLSNMSILGVVATCACGSLGSHLYMIMNVRLGREKHVLETESNSIQPVTLVQLVVLRFHKLKLVHGNIQLSENTHECDQNYRAYNPHILEHIS